MVLSTLLGSCVAACLYDEVGGVMGMNHFLLADRGRRREPLLASEAGRYGILAMELLINDMLRLGARRERIKAKVFGGANVFPGMRGAGKGCSGIGHVNSVFVRDFLARDGISLVAADLGGHCARMVHFSAPDYAVLVKHVPSRSAVAAVVSKERRLLDRTREQRRKARAAQQVDFW